MKAVNLLPPDMRAADRKSAKGAAGPATQGKGGLAVLTGLGLVVLAVIATVLAGNSIKSNERELAEVQAEQRIAQAQLDVLSPYGSFQQLASTRVKTVRDLASARFDWEQALRDLSRAIPGDVTLDQINGSVIPGSAGSSSSNPLRAAIQAPAIELTGCARDQTSVARLMSRLRAVQGVTRVSLASSAKEDNDAGSTTTAPDAKRVGCGLGSPPKFAMVMFFETATAQPSTAPGTAVPAAATPTPAPGAAATPTPAPTDGAPAPAATPTPVPGAAQPAAATEGATTP